MRFEYIDWYNHQPLWARVVCFPTLFPVMLVHAAVGMVFLLIVILPYLAILTIQWKLSNYQFWQRLRKREQVAPWLKVQEDINRKTGTLVVEVGPKGLVCSWWINQPRGEIDPERLVPSWHDFEEREWSVFEPGSNYDRVERWAVERLCGFESSAKAVLVSWSQLSKLPLEIKQEAVIVMLCCDEGTLTSRIRFEQTR